MRGSVATGHGSKNRGHREREGEQGNSPRPMKWPENAAEAAVAMAGGREQSGARETDTRSHETRIKLHREREGTTKKLTAVRNGVYGGSETAVHAEGWTADPDDLGAAVFGVHGSCECKMGAGIGSKGARGGHGSLL